MTQTGVPAPVGDLPLQWIPRPDRGPLPLARAGAVVAPAMAVANLAQYALQLTASRALTPAGFGAFGALLGLGVLGAVPMLALQTVTARQVALRAGDAAGRGREVSRLLGLATRIGLGLSGLGLVAAPLVAAFLHLGVVPAALLGLSLGPLAVAGAAQGVLQGRERFAALAGVFLLVAGLRVLGGVAGLLLSASVPAALAGTATGALLAAASARVVVRREGAPGPRPAGTADLRPPLRRAASGVLAVLALGSVDLLLARHLLPGPESGRYAVGGLVARGCFWAPQFVAVLVVPRVTRGQRRILSRAVGLVGGLGALEVAAALALPPPVLRLVFGDAYGSLARLLAVFALTGALLALLQLLLQAGIARGSGAVGLVGWLAVGTEVTVALLLRPGLVGLVTLSAVTVAATVLACLWTTTTGRRHG